MDVLARPGRTAAKYSRTGDVHPMAGFDEGEDGGDFGSSLLAADVDPVFATDGHGAHGVFSEVVAQFEFRVLQEAREFRPKRQRVIRGFGQGAGGQCGSVRRGHGGLDLLQ